MLKCKNCNEKDAIKYSEYSSGEFCSIECSKSYSTKNDKKTLKKANCRICGEEIMVDKRSSIKNVLCDVCKKNNKKIYRITSKSNIIVKKTDHIIFVCKTCGLEKCEKPEICKHYNLIPGLIKYFGFDENKIGTIEFYEEFDRIKNMLIEDYYDNNLSIPLMCEKYSHDNCRNFSKILNSFGIKRRNLSESQIILIKNGKKIPHSLFPYKYGWHTTWNNKQIFYRSSYELDYAKELDKKEINYEVEKLRILYWDSQLLKQRVAIPDFYLTETNLIIEIKSEYTYNEINMKDKFKSYKKHGYNCKLILDHKDYNL